MTPEGSLARACATPDYTWQVHGHGNGAASSPRRPQPCLQEASSATIPSFNLPTSTIDPRQDVLRHYHRQSGGPRSHHNASVSSAGGSSTRTARTLDSIDLEKAALRVEQRGEQRGSLQGSLQPSRPHSNMDMIERRIPSTVQGSVPSRSSVVLSRNLEELSREDEPDDKAIKLLIFLSAPLVAVSFVTLLCALFYTILSLLIQPLRICTRRPGLGEQLASFLGPLLNLHLRCIYSPSETTSVNLVTLLCVLLLSPLLAFGVALWSWIVAVYWLFAAMVGNPDGLDGRDDGRELILSLRRWWKGWLLTAVVSS